MLPPRGAGPGTRATRYLLCSPVVNWAQHCVTAVMMELRGTEMQPLKHWSNIWELAGQQLVSEDLLFRYCITLCTCMQELEKQTHGKLFRHSALEPRHMLPAVLKLKKKHTFMQCKHIDIVCYAECCICRSAPLHTKQFFFSSSSPCGCASSLQLRSQQLMVLPGSMGCANCSKATFSMHASASFKPEHIQRPSVHEMPNYLF